METNQEQVGRISFLDAPSRWYPPKNPQHQPKQGRYDLQSLWFLVFVFSPKFVRAHSSPFDVACSSKKKLKSHLRIRSAEGFRPLFSQTTTNKVERKNNGTERKKEKQMIVIFTAILVNHLETKITSNKVFFFVTLHLYTLIDFNQVEVFYFCVV